MIFRAFVAACVLTLAWPMSALAHAVLESSTPAASARLATSPHEIVLRFNEPVTPVAVRLVDSRGSERARVADGNAAARDVRIPVVEALKPGRYLVSYRVISDDAHPVAETFAFDVASDDGESTATASPAAEDLSSPDGDAWRRGVLFNRAAFVFAILMASGGALFLAYVRPGVRLEGFVRGQIRIASYLALLLAATSVAFAGAQLVGGSTATLYDPSAWLLALKTSLGRSLLVSLVGLFGLLSVTRASQRPSAAALVGFAALVVAGRALTGHSATTSPFPLMMLVQALHAFVAAFWIGSLLPLFRGLAADVRSDAAAMLRRFSGAAVAAVGVLIAAGAIMAYVLVRTPDALAHSYYGRILIGKLSAVALLLIFAAMNKLWFTRGIERGQPAHAAAMRATIILEVFLMINVMAATSSLGASQPPHRSGIIQGNAHALVWTIEQRGKATTFRFDVQALSARVQFARADGAVEPIVVEATRDAPRSFSADMSAIAMKGNWRVTVEALVTEFDKERFETSLQVE